MSVVVAIKDKDRVYVGCDSQATIGCTKRTLSNKHNCKIFKPENDKDVIIGTCGDFRDANLLYCVNEYIDELTRLKNQVDFKYVVTKIVPKIFSTLKDNGRIKASTDTLKSLPSSILFVYKTSIYRIFHDGCVIEVDDYIAMGSGANNAMGYLNVKDPQECPKKALQKSIEASCVSDLYVMKPIVIMNTVDDDVTIIN